MIFSLRNLWSSENQIFVIIRLVQNKIQIRCLNQEQQKSFLEIKRILLDSKIKLFLNSSLKGKIHKFNKPNELFPYWLITFIRKLKWRYILFRDFRVEYVRGQWLRTTDWTQFHETYNLLERSRAWNKTDPFPGRWRLIIGIGIFERALERSNFSSGPRLIQRDEVHPFISCNWSFFIT